MKEAILVVSFGTTHPDTLEKNITAVERQIAAVMPGIPCFRAFTSNIVRKRLLEKLNIAVDSPAQALARLRSEGYERVLVQPTLLLPGEEYDLLRQAVMDAAGDMEVAVGLPLLWDDRDLKNMASILKQAYPLPEDTVLLAMGHGTTHAADSIYTRLRGFMNEQGMELCTVEGSIDFDAAVAAMLSRPQRKAHLVPLLLVAGDHSQNDMAGEEPESLRSRLEAAGFCVSWSLQGLGEIPSVREQYCRRAASLI